MNVSLEDYISQSKPNQQRGGNPQNKRRNSNQNGQNGRRKFSKPKKWEHDMYERDDYQNTSFRNNNSGNKQNYRQERVRCTLKIQNLHYSVMEKDLTDLFSIIGTLKKVNIDWDEIGRSKGSATIEFERQDQAQAAIDEYDGSELDGQKISVQFAQSNIISRLKRNGFKQKSFGNSQKRFNNNNNNSPQFRSYRKKRQFNN